MKISVDAFSEAIRGVGRVLEILGLTSKRLGFPELDLDGTPERVVKMWVEMTEGLRTTVPEVTAFESDHTEMLALTKIPFVSLCSHHLAPFRGEAHFAYIPKGKVLGISKPARVIDHFALRPQTQELLTKQVADYLCDKLKPLGVMVVIEAEHTCISCRGAHKPGSKFVTSAVRGVFLEDPGAKAEFLSLINSRGS